MNVRITSLNEGFGEFRKFFWGGLEGTANLRFLTWSAKLVHSRGVWGERPFQVQLLTISFLCCSIGDFVPVGRLRGTLKKKTEQSEASRHLGTGAGRSSGLARPGRLFWGSLRGTLKTCVTWLQVTGVWRNATGCRATARQHSFV